MFNSYLSLPEGNLPKFLLVVPLTMMSTTLLLIMFQLGCQCFCNPALVGGNSCWIIGVECVAGVSLHPLEAPKKGFNAFTAVITLYHNIYLSIYIYYQIFHDIYIYIPIIKCWVFSIFPCFLTRFTVNSHISWDSFTSTKLRPLWIRSTSFTKDKPKPMPSTSSPGRRDLGIPQGFSLEKSRKIHGWLEWMMLTIWLSSNFFFLNRDSA